MKVLLSLWDFLQTHVFVLSALSAAGGALSAMMAAFLSDYFKFREYKRANTQADLEKSKLIQLPLDMSLHKFSDKALGLNEVTPDDLRELQHEIKNLRNNAKNLVDRLPALSADFDRLSESLVKLQKNAQIMNGPIDAKGFVQSVADYYSSANNFFSRAARLQHIWAFWGKRQLRS